MIRHVIVFNAEESPERVRAMAERARRILGSVRGVTDVRFGIAIEEMARYRYLLDIGFEDASVIESYRRDPAHVRFADDEFRPLARDRVTTDYWLEY